VLSSTSSTVVRSSPPPPSSSPSRAATPTPIPASASSSTLPPPRPRPPTRSPALRSTSVSTAVARRPSRPPSVPLPSPLRRRRPSRSPLSLPRALRRLSLPRLLHPPLGPSLRRTHSAVVRAGRARPRVPLGTRARPAATTTRSACHECLELIGLSIAACTIPVYWMYLLDSDIEHTFWHHPEYSSVSMH
jgi:hypothetical protein